MIIKLEKIICCSSEHPSYPASNLLEYHSNRSWRCAKPGEMLATVIFQMSESSCITGLDIGNYRSCVVIVEASTVNDPDKWVPIVNHRFLTNDEAANNKFRDQVQIFTKRELNPDTIKIKFDRIKVTCMQSANPREIFGLSFITFKTEVVIDLGLDVFGRFKLKDSKDEKKSNVDELKDKYLKLMNNKQNNYRDELKVKVKEISAEKFMKRQEEARDLPKTLPELEDSKMDTVFDQKDFTNKQNDAKKEDITFEDLTRPSKQTSEKDDESKTKMPSENKIAEKHSLDDEDTKVDKKLKVSNCCTEDKLCKNCGLLYKDKENNEKKNVLINNKKKKKEFNKLFEGITFSLSGYVNPQRDSIRRKALQMGAKYIADPNTSNNVCTHLICAFANTPKYQQLKNYSKIVSHKFIEDCFQRKIRFPWRRYALDKHDKNQPESEEEIEANSSNSYDMDTDDSDY